MVYLGLNFKVSKHSKKIYIYRTTKVVLCKTGHKKPHIEKKDKLLKSGGNANFKKAKRPPIKKEKKKQFNYNFRFTYLYGGFS